MAAGRAGGRQRFSRRAEQLAKSCLAGAVLACCGGGARPPAADAGPPECEDGRLQTCYPADPATLDVGACAAGVSLCLGGRWGLCEDAVLPSTELCDGMDNDCDGAVDEGVLPACGVCGTCGGACFGLGAACEAWEVGDHEGFSVAEGALVPEARGVASTPVAWIPSFNSGHVFRVDATTLETRASYWSGSQHGMNGDRPREVLVDLEGNAIIANEANGLVASITKIANERRSCLDRNGSGVIETSMAWDDRLDFRAADDWDDECILWHTELGTEGAVGLASVDIDGVERGWVGLNPDGLFLEFDPSSGELTGEEVSTGELDPNSAAADAEGWVWYSASDAVGRFDARDPARGAEVMDASLNGRDDVFNVMVDEYDLPWAGGDQVWRWDPVSESFVSLDLPYSGWAWGFGYTMASDGRGTVWVGSRDAVPELYRISNDEHPSAEVIPLEAGGHFAVDVDSEGRVWAVPGSPAHTATSVLDPATGSIDSALDDCAGAACIDTTNAGRGDFTGLQLRNVRKPVPLLTRVVSSCDVGARTRWATLSVDAVVPDGNDLRLDVRAAQTLEALRRSRWTTLGHVSLDGLDFELQSQPAIVGTLLELRLIVLQVAEAQPPVIRTIRVEWGCSEGPG